MSATQGAVERFYRRKNSGIKLGLDVMEALAAKLGNPERTYGVIHVAGTNGKGSVCAMIESVLRAAGLRTGLYTSPHLVDFNERICVNGRSIGDDDLGALVEEVDRLVAETDREAGREVTFFECSTAIAMQHFRRQGVQVAILETGMGGRLDATNIVLPLVSVITRVSLEHTVYLGPDIESIAAEKGGIIKPKRPVVCGRTDERALSVLRGIAVERGAPFIAADEQVTVEVVSRSLSGQKVRIETAGGSYGAIQIPLLGAYQVENVVTAVAALEVLGDAAGVKLSESAVRKGLESTRWPGRLQVWSQDPPVLLDSGHNPGAAEALAASLKQMFKRKPIGLVFGLCTDKDAGGFLRALAPSVKRAWAVPLQTERSAPVADLLATAQAVGMSATGGELAGALGEARQWARESGGVVVVAGSLFLVGEVLAMAEGREC
jgi:dihydrofolate synthase/folylpolyglutamate synthase